MKYLTTVRRILLTALLSLTMLITGGGAFARERMEPMSFRVPGGCVESDSFGRLLSDYNQIRLDLRDVDGCIYEMCTLKGLFGGYHGLLGQPGSYVILDDGDAEDASMMGRSVTYWGSKVGISWKVSYKNTVHTRPEFQMKKGKKIYCSFTYTTPSDSVYMGIADPWDRLTLRLCSGGVFSSTFTANYSGGYHFVVANRGYKTITVKGYFKVEK